MSKVVIDSNVLVAIIDSRDKWHDKSKELVERLYEQKTEPIYFDCVLNETISVLGRRLEEQKRSHEFSELIDSMLAHIPNTRIEWISSDVQRLYTEIIALVKDSFGTLNFHDALIALKSRELGVESILSFDKDFDDVDWVLRVC